MIEIVNLSNSNFQFHIKSKSGSTLLESKEYSAKADLETAVLNLDNLQIHRSNFERKTNHEGKFLFNFKDNNGYLIGTSQLYDSEAGMENGIKNLHNRLTEGKES
ncbi:YegP family protein [Zobellia roscoffensis]|uniref:YegP family protein n=1 Tax=Zobellia roscoffensis TaxID=2779508 RepID=UPI00188BBB0F|nr:YegP family protein [Zobellia roscoffensis]